MNQNEARELRIDRVVRAIKTYIEAEISFRTTEQEADSLGAYHEEQELREALDEVLP